MHTVCADHNPFKFALITGSSRGLGRAIADQLESKWRVVRHGKTLTSAGDVPVVAADLSTDGGAETLWRETLAKTDGVVPELAVLCAACGHPEVGCLSPDADAFMRCNFFSSCDLIRLCVRAGVARVICISSGAARLRTQRAGAYCTSKDLLETYVKHAASEALPATIVSVCRVDVLLDTGLCAQLNSEDDFTIRRDPRCALPLILALSREGARAAGRVFCLSRALISLPDELKYCANSITAQRYCAFAEPAAADSDTLVVNGDNLLEEDGAYPEDAQARSCSAAMATCLGIDAARVLTVQGGITGALEAACAALSVWDCDVVVYGQLFGGLEWVLRNRSVNFVQCSSPSALKGLMNPQTRLVLVTQPSSYFCVDQSSFVREAFRTLPSSVALVLDECYMPYTRDLGMATSLSSPDKHINGPIVIGLRGISKLHGLARLRLGFLVSDERTVSLARACVPFKSMPRATLIEAKLCLSEPSFTDERRRRYLAEKCHVGKRLRRAGLTPRGNGPYVVLSLSELGCRWETVTESLESRGVKLQPAVPDHVVYMLASRRWNNIFCNAITEMASSST